MADEDEKLPQPLGEANFSSASLADIAPNPEAIRNARVSGLMHGLNSSVPQEREMVLKEANGLFPEVDQAIDYAIDVQAKKRGENLAYEDQFIDDLRKDPLREAKWAYYQAELVRRKRLEQEEQKQLGVLEVKHINPEDLNVYHKLGINPETVTHLYRSINRLKKVDLNPYVHEALLMIRTDGAFAVPIAASMVCAARDPNREVISPTAEQVAKLVSIVDYLPRVVSLFSAKYGERVRGWVNKKAEIGGRKAVLSVLPRVREVLEIPGAVANPKQQMLKEVDRLYREVIERSQDNEDSSPWWEDFIMGEDTSNSAENVLSDLFDQMKMHSAGYKNLKGLWFNETDYPLLTNLLNKSHLPTPGGSSSVAAVEVLSGINQFLVSHGRRSLPPPQPSASLLRFGAEVFASDRLEAVTRQLPTILEDFYNLLPENGPQFTENIYQVADNIVEAKKQGMSDQEIVKLAFPV